MSDQQREIDKAALYEEWRAGEKRRSRIYERGAMKALDLADDEMNVETTVVKNGIGPLGIASIAAAFGLPATIIAGAFAWNALTPDPSPVAPATQAPNPAIAPAVNVDTDSTLYLLDERPNH